jgi:hypothetical protein
MGLQKHRELNFKNAYVTDKLKTQQHIDVLLRKNLEIVKSKSLG